MLENSGTSKKRVAKLSSYSARLEAAKEKIRIRVLGFGWDDLHHVWSKDGYSYTPEELRDYLINIIIPQQKKRGVPDKPTMNLPSRRKTKQLGKKTADLDVLDDRYEDEKRIAMDDATKLRDQMEASGVTDRYEKLQQKKAPAIKEAFLGTFIEQLWSFTEEDGKVVDQWCQGEVVGVMKNNKVLIEWSNDCLREGDPKVTKEKLLVSLWNKHKEGAWRLDIDKN